MTAATSGAAKISTNPSLERMMKLRFREGHNVPW